MTIMFQKARPLHNLKLLLKLERSSFLNFEQKIWLLRPQNAAVLVEAAAESDIFEPQFRKNVGKVETKVNTNRF